MGEFQLFVVHSRYLSIQTQQLVGSTRNEGGL